MKIDRRRDERRNNKKRGDMEGEERERWKEGRERIN